MAKIREGGPAPAFALPAAGGQKVSLADFKGKKNVVLYFYPKDNTPGCTREACDFQAALGRFAAADAVVLGVSADSPDSHGRFSAKHGLGFPLLSDETRAVLKKYGVWKQKMLYGRKFMGIERTTVVIDKKGKIGRIFPKVRVDGHWKECLEAVRGLAGAD
jgi:peroxiredoxin Q/BCP